VLVTGVAGLEFNQDFYGTLASSIGDTSVFMALDEA
jgi:hypothetical protein